MRFDTGSPTASETLSTPFGCGAKRAWPAGNPIRLRLRCHPVMFQRQRTRIRFSESNPFGRHMDFAMQQEQLKVLLIEDDEGFARAVGGMLEQTRDTAATVVMAPSLDAGLAQLAQSSFDIAILEFFLPDGAGLPNISLFRSAAPRVPVIAVGSADDETLAVEAVHAGAQDYLVKSQINPHWLLRSLRYAIELHRADMALLNAKVQYRGIFDHLVEGIFQTSPEGRYLMANAAL